MLDPQDEMYDRRLASHLVSLYFKSEEEDQEDHMARNLYNNTV
jgi:DNA replication licensing factor MCM4